MRLYDHSRVENSLIVRSLATLNKGDRKKILLVALFQVSLSLADLIGVGLTGILGALAITGIESKRPGNRVSWFLDSIGIGNLSLQTQVVTLAGLITLILVGRTICSLFLTRKMIFFLGRKGVALTTLLLSKLLRQSLDFVNRESSQETQFKITNGVEAITTGMIATYINILSDLSLLVVLGLGLLIVSPTLAIFSLLNLLIVGLALNKIMKRKAIELGRVNSTTRVESSEKILELFRSFREVLVRNRKSYYIKEISLLRSDLASAISETAFMPNISKYVVEITVVIGAMLIGATQFAMQDASHAIATLTIFMAAGSRLAPAVLRLQQGYLTFRSNQIAAESTLNLLAELEDISAEIFIDKKFELNYRDFTPTVELINVSKKYLGGSVEALKDINLRIDPGAIVALVGPSGAGKTTLVDVILGVSNPTTGVALLSGLPSVDAIEKWPGAVAYVPQDILITNGTIKSNITLGFSDQEISSTLVWDALKMAHLEKFVESLPESINYSTGERGYALSGGQRQRLGIARALVTKPRILVLDEATSALDSETENSISNSIEGLRGASTVILIAHRLSTVRNADRIIYMELGRIVATGTFDEVRALVPNFDAQARLMGI